MDAHPDARARDGSQKVERLRGIKRSAEADTIPAEEAGALPGLLQLRTARSPDEIAYEQY